MNSPADLNLSHVAHAYQEFADLVCRGSSPLYERLAGAVAGDLELLELASHCRTNQPPNLFFSAVHYLLLKGERHELAGFYPSLGGAASENDPYPIFKSFCRKYREAILGLIQTRLVQTNEIGRYACMIPGFLMAADKANGRPLALIEIGASAGLGLLWDCYGYRYSNGTRCGNTGSSVQINCELRGERTPRLATGFPEIVFRVGLDLNPIDIHDSDATLWLQALIWPEHVERFERLRRAIELAKQHPLRILAGDATRSLPEALAEVPQGAAMCIFTSFTLSQFPADAGAAISTMICERSISQEIYQVSLEWAEGRGPLLEFITYKDGQLSERLLLAACDPHGSWLEWLHADSSHDKRPLHYARQTP